MDIGGLIPSRDKQNVSFQHYAQNVSRTDPISHSMCTVSFFLTAKLLETEADHSPLPMNCVDLYFHFSYMPTYFL
jgi:hypothetical protein